MGQIVNVIEHASSRPGVVRFETNRVLSGTGHDRFVAGEPIERNRPVDELARRLFAHGGVAAVHVNGSVVTVDLAKGHRSDGLADVIRGLYTYYVDAPTPAAGNDVTGVEQDAGDGTEPAEADVAGQPATHGESVTGAEVPAPTPTDAATEAAEAARAGESEPTEGTAPATDRR
jgi:hypothetical protein